MKLNLKFEEKNKEYNSRENIKGMLQLLENKEYIIYYFIKNNIL